MATIDWDWQNEFTACKKRIFDLEVDIEVRKLEINRLSNDGRDTTLAARALTISEDNLRRAQDHRRFIETKMTGHTGRDSAA